MPAMDVGGPGPLGTDRLIRHYGGHGALAAELQAGLADRGYASADTDLAKLHLRIAADLTALDGLYMNGIGRSFYLLDDGFLAHYRNLIAFLASEVLETDFLFQSSPVVRFHFPAPFPPALRAATGRGQQLHSDLLGGHPTAMVNGWLALTVASGSNALHLSSLAAGIAILRQFTERLALDETGFRGSLSDFFSLVGRDPAFADLVEQACPPLAMAPGDVVLFDPRCVHGGIENREATTRVSMDFRLLPLPERSEAYEAEIAAAYPRWVRGDILHALSAWEMLDNRR